MLGAQQLTAAAGKLRLWPPNINMEKSVPRASNKVTDLVCFFRESFRRKEEGGGREGERSFTSLGVRALRTRGRVFETPERPAREEGGLL